MDIASAQVESSIDKAHEVPIYSLAVVDENLVATGDDDGHLKVRKILMRSSGHVQVIPVRWSYSRNLQNLLQKSLNPFKFGLKCKL